MRERKRTLSDLPALPSNEPVPTASSMFPSGEGKSPEPSKGPDDAEIDALVGDGGFSPDDALNDQIEELERWAAATERRDRAESIRFWVLRGAAFVNAALAAAATPLGYDKAAVVLAAGAALFIAIDAAWPASSFRNPYRRAVYDLRQLQGTVKLRWDKVRLAYPSPTSPKRIGHALALLDGIHAKREEIGKYLGSAEATGGIRRPSESR